MSARAVDFKRISGQVLEPREVTAGVSQAAAATAVLPWPPKMFRTTSAPSGAAVDPSERPLDAANDHLVVGPDLATSSRWQGALLSADADMVGRTRDGGGS
jgi:hypothetical protein